MLLAYGIYVFSYGIYGIYSGEIHSMYGKKLSPQSDLMYFTAITTRRIVGGILCISVSGIFIIYKIQKTSAEKMESIIKIDLNK
jgi:hypothetical protein